MCSLPAYVLVLSAGFRLHNFCIEHGEATTGAVLGLEERSVSDAAFQRWFRASQQARQGQLSGSQQDLHRDLESSKLRDNLTRGI
jgi:hypothetical protein